MTTLDAEAITGFTSGAARDRLAQLKTFSEIESTNSYLMQVPGPVPGKISIAATTNQTAGRGRHGKTWQSPPGSGVCLSAAYTFTEQPKNLPALTLAVGLGAVTALESLGARGIQLKWPNDLVASDGKLGGILTEVQSQSAGAVTVVAGVGVNIRVDADIGTDASSDWALQIVDLKSICDEVPGHDEIAGRLTSCLLDAFVDYETNGFSTIAERWSKYDWLVGRQLLVETAQGNISGIGAGIAQDGALLVDTPEAGVQRVTTGSIIAANSQVSLR